MPNDDIISQLTTMTGMVHVSDSGAYEAFAKGSTVFDISSDGKLLGQFIEGLKLEFGASVIQRAPFNWPSYTNVEMYTVYNKHKAAGAAIPELGEIEDLPLSL